MLNASSAQPSAHYMYFSFPSALTLPPSIVYLWLSIFIAFLWVMCIYWSRAFPLRILSLLHAWLAHFSDWPWCESGLLRWNGRPCRGSPGATGRRSACEPGSGPLCVSGDVATGAEAEGGENLGRGEEGGRAGGLHGWFREWLTDWLGDWQVNRQYMESASPLFHTLPNITIILSVCPDVDIGMILSGWPFTKYWHNIHFSKWVSAMWIDD